jgi:glutaredoxin
MKTKIVFLGVLLVAAGMVQAETYRWVDKSGRVVYSDSPPPPDAKKAEKRRLSDRVSEGDNLPYALAQAVKKYPVTLFSNECGEGCTQAKELLAKRGIPYTLKNPEASQEDATELTKLVGALDVPTLLIGKDKPMRGFEASGWNGMLDAAGYPQTAINSKRPLVKDAAVERQKAKTTAQAKAAPKQTPKKGPYAVDTEAVSPSAPAPAPARTQ